MRIFFVISLFLLVLPSASYSQQGDNGPIRKIMDIPIPNGWEYEGRFMMKCYTDTKGKVFEAFLPTRQEPVPGYVSKYFIEEMKKCTFPNMKVKVLILEIVVKPKEGPYRLTIKT